MSALTKHEQYLFSLTGSTAKTPDAQRKAIKKAGLEGKSKSELRKEALAEFEVFKNKPENKDVPLYVSKRRFIEFSLYKLENYGLKVDCYSIACLAFNNTKWGKLKKTNKGMSSLYAGIRTETNGKSGWNCVSNHYADYVLIKSPDKKKIFIQCAGVKVEKNLYKNRFILNGQVYTLSRHVLSSNTARNQCKILKKAGFQAKVVKQTNEMVMNGSGEHSKKGDDLYCVVKRNDSWYHCSNTSIITASNLKLKFLDISKAEKEKEFNEKCMSLIKNQPNLIWVSQEDSLAAGNCLPGTQIFEKLVNKNIKSDYPIGAIRADILLSIRNDNFVLKAIKHAARRVA